MADKLIVPPIRAYASDKEASEGETYWVEKLIAHTSSLRNRIDELETAIQAWADLRKSEFNTRCSCTACLLNRLINPLTPDTRIENARREWIARSAQRVATMEAVLAGVSEDPPTPKTE